MSAESVAVGFVLLCVSSGVLVQVWFNASKVRGDPELTWEDKSGGRVMKHLFWSRVCEIGNFLPGRLSLLKPNPGHIPY